MSLAPYREEITDSGMVRREHQYDPVRRPFALPSNSNGREVAFVYLVDDPDTGTGTGTGLDGNFTLIGGVDSFGNMHRFHPDTSSFDDDTTPVLVSGLNGIVIPVDSFSVFPPVYALVWAEKIGGSYWAKSGGCTSFVGDKVGSEITPDVGNGGPIDASGFCGDPVPDGSVFVILSATGPIVLAGCCATGGTGT
jgi:hypothetical protein